MKGAVCALLALLCLAGAAQGAAQAPPCGYADAVSFPVDLAAFTLVQGYGAPSVRHQGRYHTGEDWTRREDPAAAYGEFVRAIAAGRVTYAAPNGWGADGGVIILEHTFRDGEIAYSMYGHLTDATGVQFPAAFSCVQRGDILAAIGDARPAPHLHLEIRVNTPSSPGAGYGWDSPTRAGYRRPTKMLLNWGARLLDAFRWRLDLGDETGPAAAPLPLSDGGLLIVDRLRLSRLHPNGGALWRVNLASAPLALLPDPTGALLLTADGAFARYSADGTLIESWQLGFSPLAAFTTGGLLLYGADGALSRYDTAARALVWRTENLPPPTAALVYDDGALIQTVTNEIIALDGAGAALDRAALREAAALALDTDGVPLVYGRGGLWRVQAGVWSPALEFAPAGGARAAVHADAEGYLLFDGARFLRYGRDGAGVWQSATAPTVGRAALQRIGSFYLLATSGGDLAVVRAADGALCAQTRVFGDAHSRMWAGIGADGLLRVHAADQVIAFEWRALLGACGG